MSVEIEAAGLACPLGLRRRPTLAAIRANLRAFRAPGDGPCRSQLREPKIGAERIERASFFLRHALGEVLEGVVAGPRRLDVHLIAPEPLGLAPLDEDALARVVGELLAQASWAAGSFELHRGRAGALEAWSAAQRAIDAGAEQVLIAATECLTSESALARLSAQRSLLGQARDEGVIPGEGAAALLLRSPAVVWPQPALARVTTVERPTSSEREPTWAASAEALTGACRQLRAAGPDRIDHLFSTSFPRRTSASALSVACIRSAGYVPAPANAEYIGGALGELGAAALIAALARAVDSGPALIFDYELRERVLACALDPA